MAKKYIDEAGLATLWTLIKNLVGDLDDKTLKIIGSNTNGVFIGTTAEYDAANAAGEIPVGTIVIITDDEGSAGSSIDFQALLQGMY